MAKILPRRLVPIAAAALGSLVGAGLLVGWLGQRPAGAGSAHGTEWQEVAWPFARDAWPPGRAYRCDAAACGQALVVTIRPKLGFCNCATGVSGDSEVDAVSDVDMLSEDFVPVQDGERLVVGDLVGRLRTYTLNMPDGRKLAAAGMALSKRCDVIAAAVLGERSGSKAALESITRLIDSPLVAAWLRGQLGKG